jgi:hypothetical protein
MMALLAAERAERMQTSASVSPESTRVVEFLALTKRAQAARWVAMTEGSVSTMEKGSGEGPASTMEGSGAGPVSTMAVGSPWAMEVRVSREEQEQALHASRDQRRTSRARERDRLAPHPTRLRRHGEAT